MRRALACILLLLGPGAAAQDLPVQGIAFAQAAEGTWLCRHETAADALSCAVEQCSEQSTGGDCAATAWCFPARWSGTMTMWQGESRSDHVLCGAPTEAALGQALAALCVAGDKSARCEVTNIIDPDGHEKTVSDMRFDARAPTTEASGARTAARN